VYDQKKFDLVCTWGRVFGAGLFCIGASIGPSIFMFVGFAFVLIFILGSVASSSSKIANKLASEKKIESKPKLVTTEELEHSAGIVSYSPNNLFFDKGHCPFCKSIDNWNTQGCLQDWMVEALEHDSCDKGTIQAILNSCVVEKDRKIKQEALEVKRILEEVEEEEKRKAIEQKKQHEQMIKMQESMVYVGDTPPRQTDNFAAWIPISGKYAGQEIPRPVYKKMLTWQEVSNKETN
jgi:hypothetical protein